MLEKPGQPKMSIVAQIECVWQQQTEGDNQLSLAFSL